MQTLQDAIQTNGPNKPLPLEDMFAQILTAVQKSVSGHFSPALLPSCNADCSALLRLQSAEIAELRQESNELKQANKELQAQILKYGNGLSLSMPNGKVSLQLPVSVSMHLNPATYSTLPVKGAHLLRRPRQSDAPRHSWRPR